jgi:hypothetical protein
MNQQESLSPKAKFPERKKQNFQAKFAQLLKGQDLESEDGLEFGFDHNYPESERNEEELSEQSGKDSQQDLDYEDQIRDLKRRIMEKKELQKKQQRKNQKRKKEEMKDQFECYDFEEKTNWKNETEKSFHPDDLRLSRYHKPQYHESREKHRKMEHERDNDSEREMSRQSKKEKRMSIKHHKESPTPRNTRPPLSHKSSTKVSTISKKNKSRIHKQSMITVSNYKKDMIFSAKLKLKKIKFGSRKAGVLKFDIEYNNNFIPARKNHEIKGYQTNIKEIFEVPFRAIYDRRKRQFYCESIIVNVMNMHKRYNKRLGQLEVDVSGILNKQQSYFNGQLKLKNTNDRQAKLEITLTLKLEGIAEKEDVKNKNKQYHFDDSYFSHESDR